MVPDALFLGLGARTSSDTPSVAITAAGPSVVSKNCCRTLLGLGGLQCSCPLSLLAPGGCAHCCSPCPVSFGGGLQREVVAIAAGIPCPALWGCALRLAGAQAAGWVSSGAQPSPWGAVPAVGLQALVTELPAPPAPPHAAAPRGRSTSLALFALGPGSGRSDVDQAHERCPPPPAQSHQTLPGTSLTPWAHRGLKVWPGL